MRLRLLTTLTLAATALAACGGAGSDAEPASPPAPSSPPAEPVPAPAEPPAPGWPEAELAVEVTHPERETIAFQLVCSADGAAATPADAVDADAACGVLANADAVRRLVDGAPADAVCTEIYGGPDVATISGTIGGEAVQTTVDRANGCGIADWDLLSGLLPPPGPLPA